MKQFLKQNIILILLFLAGIGTTFYLFSKEQIPTSQNVVQQEQEEQIENNAVDETETDTKKQDIKKSINQVEIQLPKEHTEQPTPIETSTKTETSNEPTEQATIAATLIIPKIGYEKTIDLPPESSAYDLMKTLQGQGLVYKAEEHGSLGAFVSSIGGIKNDYKEHMFWIYYINGQKAHIGISNYIIHQDDIITWQYEAEEI